MPKPRPFRSLEFFRRRLADVEALPQLATLAVLAGLLSGGVIVVFRLIVDVVLAAWLPGANPENFEGLPTVARVLVPLSGAAVIGLALTRLASHERRVGVVHVMERLSRHQGHLPLKNALVQFIGGILCLVSGQSGGREGPAIHLGATSASYLGQLLHLPNNSMRTLVACGTAAAIAGSFNTPVAGVIFAMEVVMMEYTIASFIPVILSSVCATVLMRAVFGNEPAFLVPQLDLATLNEIPYVIFCGLVVGTIAAGYIRAVQGFARLDRWPFWARMLLAGGLTAVSAIFAPAVLGVGYDTVSAALLGQLGVVALTALVIAKFISSAASVGLGMPIGLIGPTFVIGAAVGGVLGVLGGVISPDVHAHTGFYVMLGMAAMMAAVLQAPLAALMAVLELTANPNLILPAMLIIVVATMTTNVGYRQRSVFLSTLSTLGLEYPPSPVAQQLQRASIASVMDRAFVRLPVRVSAEEAQTALDANPRYVLIETGDGKIRSALRAADLAAFLADHDDIEEAGESDVDPSINLMELPGMRQDTADIDSRATLLEAAKALESGEAEVLCARRTTAPMIAPVLGVITEAHIATFREAL